MKINAKITDVTSVNKLDFYWKNEDYINLLKEFDYPDADQLKSDEILEYLFMAVTDFEPAEAAEHLLRYKLKDKLNDGQIQNLSYEMLVDKVAEEYPDPALHFDLFNINQLLYRSFNGTFPNTEATIINLQLQGKTQGSISKEVLIKTLSVGLKDNNLVNRLYHAQLTAEEPFDDAEKVIWHYKHLGENAYEIITSKYWIEKDDFEMLEYEADLAFFQEEDS
jgi:hypothetical protein